jgi:hypothetical protein
MALCSGVRRPVPATTALFSMADSAASTQSRTPRASSTTRRATTVSTETENKLARAARSAQRLAQLSDAAPDDSTLDLFPDDPTRATLEAMDIDIRQGPLHGFELPDVVLAAVGAGTGADGVAASSEAKASRRAPRERGEAPAAALLAGFERLEPTASPAMTVDDALFSSEPAAHVPAETRDHPAADERDAAMPQAVSNLAPMTPAMAAATVARGVTALRQAAESGADANPTGKVGGVPAQRFAATFAKAATASRDKGSASISTVTSPSAAGDAAEHGAGAAPAAPIAEFDAARTSMTPKDFAAATPFAARVAPELDRARATAFADTVDALYGVISDQRRAATDHSRRMKWMLSIVVAALLVTVAIGVTQTVLLMRLTRETTAQQHRIEEMMQNQQAAMTSLLDAHLTMGNSAASTPPVAAPTGVVPFASGQAPDGVAAATTATPASKRAAKAHAHLHKPKAPATTPTR